MFRQFYLKEMEQLRSDHPTPALLLYLGPPPGVPSELTSKGGQGNGRDLRNITTPPTL